MDALIGSVIDGRYEVRAALGHGGMGRLYRAWQKSVSREVAIKLIDRSLLADPMAATRFTREAELASKLSHPNTVSVFDFGRTGEGQLYIAMELIKGRTLTALLKEAGAFPIERIVRIGMQLCDAMEAAHRLGIVHRDLKLDNVMVLDEPPGRDLVKILDFGLAKQVGDMRGTAAGFVVGTPRYIAPEVSTSGIATPPADMYAVGMMLTELAIGGPLWGGDSLGELLAKKLDPQPAIAQVPEALRVVTRALLDASPERRPDAVAARELLARVGRGERIEAVPLHTLSAPTVAGRPAQMKTGATAVDRPVPRRTKRRWVIVGAIGGAVVASVVAVVATRAHDRKHPETLGGSAHVASAGSAPVASEGGAAVASGGSSAPVAAGGGTDPWAAAPAGAVDAVKVHVVSVPPGAAIEYAHQPIGIAPVDLQLPRGSEQLWVAASLGDVHGVRFVVPDHDQIVRVIMARDVWLHGTCAACLPPGNSPGHEVTLHVRGPLAIAHVMIEGQDFGGPPFDLVVRRSTAPLAIKAGSITLDVVPDSNQRVLVDSCDDCVE